MILIGAGTAVVALCALSLWAYTQYRGTGAQTKNVGQIETVRVSKQNLINSISVTGTIASADARDVQAGAKNVEVLQVNFGVGDYVNKGDVVVVLDAADLELSLTQARNSQALSEYKGPRLSLSGASPEAGISASCPVRASHRHHWWW